MKLEVFKALEFIKSHHDVEIDEIKIYIEEQETKISNLTDTVSELRDEVNGLQDEADKMYFEYPTNFNNNIVMVSALEKMFANLDRIPVDKLDEFVDQYAV